MHTLKEELLETLSEYDIDLTNIMGYRLAIKSNDTSYDVYVRGIDTFYLEKFLAKVDELRKQNHKEKVFFEGEILLDNDSYLVRKNHKNSDRWEYVFPPKEEEFVIPKVEKY